MHPDNLFFFSIQLNLLLLKTKIEILFWRFNFGWRKQGSLFQVWNKPGFEKADFHFSLTWSICFSFCPKSGWKNWSKQSIKLHFDINYPQSKLHIPSTLNIDLILWHTQLIVCAENVKSWSQSWFIAFTFQAYTLPHSLNCMYVSLFKFHIWILKQF